MSFTGDLAHLPIVDVIQLIHSTRKSGTLSIKSHMGESQLVFSDGYFASANHLNNSVRIGQILVEKNFITQECLDQALLDQRQSGSGRKPLIATLIEQDAISPDNAYSGLECLIEMTIVEVLTWTSGTFSLDVEKVDTCDEYRYFPEILKREILLNAQAILLDALRIYDEKMRDGTLEDIFFSSGQATGTGALPTGNAGQSVTADLLGLDALDSLTKKIPDVFIGLKDHDTAEEHRTIIAAELGKLTHDGQEKLCSLLTRISTKPILGEGSSATGRLPLAVIVFSRDPFIKHAIRTICRHKDSIVFTTDDDANLDLIIEQSFSRDLLPLLILDDPAFIGSGYINESVTALLQQKRDRYPRISILQLSMSLDDQSFPVHVLEEGVETLFPRPCLGEDTDSFVTAMAGFLQSFSSVIEKSFTQPDRQAARKLKESIIALGTLREPPEIAQELLLYASCLFERAITFVAGASELIAEKGIGINAEKSSGPTGPLMFKIPLGQHSVFLDVIEKRRMYYGLSSDELLKTHLYNTIGTPHSSKILLLPLMMSGNVIALIYADFGRTPPTPVQTEYLEIVARHAGLVLDNSLYRKKFEKLTRQP
ncbi:MAG: DUF4388 domain-containing protein [Verrucomicrobia bacterium]|nr:DUF4388 domain-containing protein [Deltaproteobacteria bacterium]